MTAAKAIVLVVVGSTCLVLCGCGLLSGGRTCDQGCSNPLQATAKILSNRLDRLNPDDVQVLADLVIQAAGAQIPAVTNEQAAAVISFLRANNITTIEQLQELIDEAEQNPSVLVIPDDVLAVLQAIAANQDLYVQAAQQQEI
jgi:K+-transporting ATPase c subunit